MIGSLGDVRSQSDLVSQTEANLRSDLQNKELARHLALFFRSVETQLESVAAFVDRGLQTDHRCLYLADVNAPQQIEDALRAANVDVESRIDAGDLLIKDASEVYLDSGFDPRGMIQMLRDACETSLSDGYDGLWVAGENSWCFHTDVTFDHIVGFEAEFDATAPELPVTALCQYDLTKFGERSTAKALRTHKQVIYRHAVCENPFYVPPDEYDAAADPHQNAQFMLEQAFGLSQAQRQIRRREQRLSVLNRTLRHNIRNDINVVEGRLRSVLESGQLDERNAENLRTALKQTEAIVEMAEKARYVQRTIDDSLVDYRELDSLIESAVNAIEEMHPDAAVEVSGREGVHVLADRNLDRALVELLTNAITYQESTPATVSLTVSIPTENTVRLGLRNPGPPLPKHERRVLHRGQETQLEHASGLGLWLAKWIIENANGRIETPDGQSDQDQVVIELYRVP